MARKRLLSPGFFENETLASLPAHARLLYAGLWTLADREGRMKCIPFQIHGMLFPFEPTLAIQGLLNDLSQAGFIRMYRVDGVQYLDIPSFKLHQKPHANEAQSKCPEHASRTTVRDNGSPRVANVAPYPESRSGIPDPETKTEYEPPPSTRWDVDSLRHSLGGTGTIPPLQQIKWCGISEQPREDVQGLVEWASGRDRPLQAFLNCFDGAGLIIAKKRAGNAPRGETQQQEIERFQAEHDARVAAEAEKERVG